MNDECVSENRCGRRGHCTRHALMCSAVFGVRIWVSCSYFNRNSWLQTNRMQHWRHSVKTVLYYGVYCIYIYYTIPLHILYGVSYSRLVKTSIFGHLIKVKTSSAIQVCIGTSMFRFLSNYLLLCILWPFAVYFSCDQYDHTFYLVLLGDSVLKMYVININNDHNKLTEWFVDVFRS